MDRRSEQNLEGVHPDLVRVVRKAICYTDFTVIEGLRTLQRQYELVAKGASRTTNSRHLTGHAVDLMAKVGGIGRWDWPLYTELGKIMKMAAAEEGVAITWGGDWVKFRDGPHFELSRKVYP
jgi:peptidoglycan L-alanyl-D-glutamate endopeptidase CwlK